jgi:queuine tRNA-ribosyltransferase
MTKGYLRHLFAAGEHLGPMALSLHNLSYYFRLMKRVRTSIHEGTFSNLLREIQALYLEPPNNSTPAN